MSSSRFRSVPPRVLPALAVIAAMLAGCGGDESGSPPAEAPAAAAKAGDGIDWAACRIPGVQGAVAG